MAQPEDTPGWKGVGSSLMRDSGLIWTIVGVLLIIALAMYIF